MGQKTVRFSDLSGQLIMHDDALARIVVHEHPELGDGPVEIEALADEAEALEQAALRVAVVDLYLRDDIEPRRIVIEADVFDKLATENPMSALLISARPARRSSRRRPTAPPAVTASTTPPWSMPASRTRARSPTLRSSWSASISLRSTSA